MWRLSKINSSQVSNLGSPEPGDEVLSTSMCVGAEETR